MDEQVNTVGLRKAAVLAALYNASRQQGLGFLQERGATGMTEEEAAELLKDRTPYFDYLHGRVMKVNLKDDEGFAPYLYDRDNGQGAAEAAIAPLRAKGE